MADTTFEMLGAAIRRTFAQPKLQIHRDTTASEIPGWDSLSHLFLVMEIEVRFGISLDAEEISNLPDVGALSDLIDKRLFEKNE